MRSMKNLPDIWIMLVLELTCTCSEASGRDQEGSERLGRLLGHPPACDAGSGAKGPTNKDMVFAQHTTPEYSALHMTGPGDCLLGPGQWCD